MNSELVKRLAEDGTLSDAGFAELLGTDAYDAALFAEADRVRRREYGDAVYLRGLIEVSSYCKNDCYYCGIRRSNKDASRYRLDEEDILACCAAGHELGFRTFVLQGGEDPGFTDGKVVSVVSKIRKRWPDSAVTLSLGEKSRESYQAYFDAGAERYLLRHEAADRELYESLHPSFMSWENRIRCLYDLREIGYAVGAGMMVGPPRQTVAHLIADLRLLEDLRPHMIGIGPFIPHKDTPFAGEKAGTLYDTLHLLAVIRLMLPDVLLPATTALGTIHPAGRELGFLAGANVIMPNLSPGDVRKKYLLYDGKICTEDEASACGRCIELRVRKAGCRVVYIRGDHAGFEVRSQEK